MVLEEKTNCETLLFFLFLIQVSKNIEACSKFVFSLTNLLQKKKNSRRFSECSANKLSDKFLTFFLLLLTTLWLKFQLIKA